MNVAQRVDFATDDGPVYPTESVAITSPLLAYNIYRTKDKQQKTRFIFMVARQL